MKRSTAWWLLLWWALSHCQGSPPFDPDSYACDPGGICPAGFVCRAFICRPVDAGVP